MLVHSALLGAELCAPLRDKRKQSREEENEIVLAEQEPYRVDRALCVARLAVVAD